MNKNKFLQSIIDQIESDMTATEIVHLLENMQDELFFDWEAFNDLCSFEVKCVGVDSHCEKDMVFFSEDLVEPEAKAFNPKLHEFIYVYADYKNGACEKYHPKLYAYLMSLDIPLICRE